MFREEVETRMCALLTEFQRTRRRCSGREMEGAEVQLGCRKHCGSKILGMTGAREHLGLRARQHAIGSRKQVQDQLTPHPEYLA